MEASADLGATPGQTFRTIIFPLALPGLVAGSIFTFSLTLGDYIIPQIIGTSRLFIGQAVYAQQGTAGNIPLAAAFTVVRSSSWASISGWRGAWGVRCALTAGPRTACAEARCRRGACLPAPADLLIFVYAFTTEEKSSSGRARLHAAMARRDLETGRTSGRRCSSR